MGINKGTAVVGNIGSLGKKIEFTALGDVVNTASRLEGINKMYGTNICVGETVYLDAKDAYVFRLLDTIRAKGKSNSSKIYELI
jgi:class 3 adenylate cyclase